jgi:hypothetical protein
VGEKRKALLAKGHGLKSATRGRRAASSVLAPQLLRDGGNGSAQSERATRRRAVFLAGHASPTTTRVYDRRRRKVTRNIVEGISI